MSSIAEVLTMPAIRLVPVQRLSCERRMQLLERLARTALNLEPEFVVILRDALAHDSLTGPAVEQAWAEVMEKVALADAAEQGLLDWDRDCPSCGHVLGAECGCFCCPAAADETRSGAADALAALAGGTGRRT